MKEFRAWSKKKSVMVYDNEDYSYGLWDADLKIGTNCQQWLE